MIESPRKATFLPFQGLSTCGFAAPFTVGFGTDEKYNEIGYAKRFSRAIGKENFSHVITQEEYWGALPMIQYHMDEPQSNPSSVPLWFLAKLAREQVTVVLSGEGADENGCGQTAIRCVFLESNTRLKGLTLRGGHTDCVNQEDDNNHGGGVLV